MINPIPPYELVEQETPQPAISRPRKKDRTIPTIGLILLLAVLGASVGGAYSWKQTLKVQRILVDGNRIVPSSEVVQLTRIRAKTLMYLMDLSEIRNNVLSQLYIKSAEIMRLLPNALRVRVEERQPIAAISQGRTMLLDNDGVTLPLPQSTEMFDVPFITGFTESREWVLGQPVTNAQIVRAVALLKQAQAIGHELYHLISEVHVQTSGDIVLYSSDAGVTILVGTNNEARKLHLLKTFWNQFVRQRGADQLRLVDLRYEDHVIARWKNSNNERKRAF